MNIMSNLLLVFAKIGAFSFGGGYVMIPLMQREVVEKFHWISQESFIDMIAISQSTPGPIAVNIATFTGYKVNGVWGSVVATFAVTIVTFTLTLILMRKLDDLKENKEMQDFFYGLRPAVVITIFAVAIKLGKSAVIDWFSWGIMLIVVLGIQKFKIHPLLCILGSGILGVIIYH